jgi:hypothetical protein
MRKSIPVSVIASYDWLDNKNNQWRGIKFDDGEVLCQHHGDSSTYFTTDLVSMYSICHVCGQKTEED